MRNKHAGFTMVEVLVALVVLTIGLLGIAALLLSSLQSGRTAMFRTQAVNLTADLADRIRANRIAQGAYNSLFTDVAAAIPACDTTGGCNEIALATTDLARWKAMLTQLLPNGEGQVVVTLPIAVGEPTNYVVTVRWAETGEVAPVTYAIGFAS